MYYLFEPKRVDWQDTMLCGKCFEQPSLEYLKIWDSISPLTGQNLQFGFSLPADVPVFDNIRTWHRYNLYSPKLMAILRNTTINFEAFPARVIVGKQEIDAKYEVFRLLEENECLAHEKTSFNTWELGKQQIKLITQPVYTQTFLSSGILLSRIAGFKNDVVIHEDLKKVFEDQGITGCDFSLRRPDKSQLGSK